MTAFDSLVYARIAGFLGPDDLGALARTCRTARAAVLHAICARADGGAAVARGDLLGACKTGFLPLVLAVVRAAGPASPVATGGLLDDPERERWENAFFDVCGKGALGVARWMVGHGARWMDGHYARPRSETALYLACKNGHLGVARWYVQAFRPGNTGDALNFACNGGQLEVVKWLVEAYFTPAPPGSAARADVLGWNGALHCACERGHVGVVQWLVDHCGITSDEARQGNCRLLFAACNSGRLALVRYIIDQFGLGGADLRACCALQVACSNGNSELVRWLMENYAPAAPILQTSRTLLPAMTGACSRGSASLVYWLVRESPFVPEEGWPAYLHAGMWHACFGRRLAIVHCLVELFDVTRAHVLDGSAGLLAKVASGYNAVVVQWLIERFALTAEDLRGVADALDGDTADHVGRWLTAFAT